MNGSCPLELLSDHFDIYLYFGKMPSQRFQRVTAASYSWPSELQELLHVLSPNSDISSGMSLRAETKHACASINMDGIEHRLYESYTFTGSTNS
jgi:hypothetical protein